jgi:hypothetical protein
MLEILLISGLGLAVAISAAAAIAPRERLWLADAHAHPWPFARDLAGVYPTLRAAAVADCPRIALSTAVAIQRVERQP